MVEKEINNAILNREALEMYIESLPKNVQLRFPSKTSASGSYGVCVIVWDMDRDLVVIVPYIHKKFRKNRQQGKREDPSTLARICVLAETGLDTEEEARQIGSIFFDDDSDVSLKDNFFPKFTMLVTSFKGVLRTSEEVLSEKNLKPVWVKRSLLGDVFEKTFTSLTEKTYGHSQLYAYERFVEYFALTQEW